MATNQLPTPQNAEQQQLYNLSPYDYALRYGYGAPKGPPAPTTPISSPQGAQQPTQPSQLATTLQQQLAAANEYKKNLQNYSDQIYNPYASNVRSQLNYSTLPSIKSAYNSRGLLNSGMEAAGEAGANAAASQDLASTRAGINQGLLGNLKTMQTAPFQTATTMAQPGGNTANFQLQNLASYLAGQYGNQNLMSQLYGNIATGGGQLIGTMVGGAGGSNNTSQNLFGGGGSGANSYPFAGTGYGAGSYMGYGPSGYGANPYVSNY